MNGAFPTPARAHNMSPPSAVESEWSDVNSYEPHGLSRTESPYSPSIPFNRGDLVTPPEHGAYYGQSQYRSNGNYGPGPGLPPVGMGQNGRRPSENGSRNSSPAVSIANSRSSDGTLSDQHSRKYRRMESELAQHYNILRAYLRGGSQQPPRPNKARDKLLRLTPVQFHELSTDVFDELQRRQAAETSSLPSRPSRRMVPPSLQPRPEFHEKRNQARQKLSSLQLSRFRDLSTDVFCELERRFPQFAGPEINRRQSPGMNRPPQNRGGPGGFVPPPRTHSRGASIGISAQRTGLKNGSSSGPMPQFGDQPGDGEFGRPMPKQFQSNTALPNKSTMIEDDDEPSGMEGRYDRSSDAFGLESAITSPESHRDTAATSRSDVSGGHHAKLLEAAQAQVVELQEKVEDLETITRTKDAEIKRLIEELTSTNNADLEKTLTDAQSSNSALRETIEQLHTDAANVERELRSKLEAAQKTQLGDTPLRAKFENLEREHQDLQDTLAQQRQITEEVRQQATGFLDEMRVMADGGAGGFEREEKLQENVHKLEEEVKEWKGRYAKAKTQLRNMRASSIGLSLAKPDASIYAKDGALQQEDGLVKDVHVTKFQISIDELLQVARATDPAAIIDHMKAVVVAVRRITGDIDGASPLSKDNEVGKKRAKLKSNVAVTANNLITASQNHAAAEGLSPVSLLDAAASHLTTAVVDLVRTVKIRPTPAGELEDDDEEIVPPTQNGYFDVGDILKRQSPPESIYSAISTPPRGSNLQSGPGPSVHSRSASRIGNGNSNELRLQPGFGLREDEDGDEIKELKLYLDRQTRNLAGSIQSLASSIRDNDVMPIIRSHISDIADAVENAVSATEGSADELPTYSSALTRDIFPISKVLTDYKTRLLTMGIESQTFDSGSKPGARDFVKQLPPLAHQTAQEMKLLVEKVEDLR